MRRAAVLLAALLVPVGAARALAPSNLDLVTETARQAVGDALADLDLGPEATAIQLHAASTHQANWLVEHLVTEELLARGLAVALEEGDDVDTRLDFRVVDLSVAGHATLLGGAVKRRCRVVLRLDLLRGGEQVSSGEGHIETTDKIPKNQLDALQHSRFGFAKTDLEQRSWGKFVEPIIITTVLGSLIYLFFSNR